ncbi:MAG: hypothetical protein JWO25_2710 [Alphaproteobacteria bacterium]|nr:hypothetical protein [Alphaproteobacteria bacterium]
MAAYFVYLFSSEAVIERVESYDCPTTQEAQAECERRAAGRYAELWHDGLASGQLTKKRRQAALERMRGDLGSRALTSAVTN